MTTSQRFYLLEFFINKIRIHLNILPLTKIEDLLIHFQCHDFLYLHVTPEEFFTDSVDIHQAPSDGFYQLDFGKTYLFTSTANKLVENIEKYPLEIDLRIARRSVGSTKFKWKKEFIDMITLFETIGVVKSFNYDGSFEITNNESKKVAQLDMVIKMSCLGDSVETYFSIENGAGYFMNPKTEVKFKCERYHMEADGITPIASLFNPLLNARISTPKLSWTELFGSKITEAKQSIAPLIMDDEFVVRSKITKKRQIEPTQSNTSQYEVLSMVFRPPENKFFDFLNMVTAEIGATDEETVVTLAIDKTKRPTAVFTDDVTIVRSSALKESPELTSEIASNCLCQSKDCPGAKKFKEYGIGPLATGSGLGTLYNIVEPPVTYGLSHTYGRFEHYGPYGCFRRPKDPNQPYYPPADHYHGPDEFEKPIPIPHCSCQRLRGGCTKSTQIKDHEICTKCCIHREKYCKHQVKIREKCCKHQAALSKEDEPRTLRLRGGGICNFEPYFATLEVFEGIIQECDTIIEKCSSQLSEHKIRLRGGGSLDPDLFLKCVTPKSAVVECKSIMDQFDQIVIAYKQALGPCGEATCPYAPNIIAQHCKDFCQQEKVQSPIQELSCESIPCKRDTCPYTEKSLFAGCGSAKCAYAKYKTGLVDDDAAMELMFLPAPVADPCGHPKCNYPPYSLPPIHWDCPEPLPKGSCKNPNCPYQPPDLKSIKCPPPIPQPRGPCGNISCPYALPSPCNNPNCPFKGMPCPYMERKIRGDPNPTCEPLESESDEICDNPNCPYKDKNLDNPECMCIKERTVESSPVDQDYCGNPTCPFAPKYPQPKKGNKSKKKGKSCGSPNCPFKSNQSTSEESICSNPECPYAAQKDSQNISVCSNPDCPFAKKKKTICACGNPNCPRAAKEEEEANSICSNPDCPYAQQKGSICSNPECPFAKKKTNGSGDASQNSRKKSSICGNPDCPYAQNSQSDSICSNPDCPFAVKNDSSVCSNPDCPFAKRSKKSKQKSSICSNPDCPFAEEYFGESSDSYSACDNPDCPFAKRRSSTSSCSNPDCPAKKRKTITCDNPDCPLNKKKQLSTFCTNPNCLYFKRDGGGRDGSGRDGGGDACGNPNCPFNMQKVHCGDPLCLKGNDPTGRLQSETTTVAKMIPSTAPARGVRSSGKRRRGKFVYSIGDKYPGVKIGHRECVTPRCKVPASMGWLWNKHTPILQMKPRRGWRPGAIEKTIAERIKAHRNAKGLGMLTLPKFSMRGARRGGQSSSESINVKPKPTLTIQKKEGTYYITMNPLKDPKTLAENEDPYMACTPMQFKITKPKKAEDNSILCHCDDTTESSSNSELDIEFTPPAGIIHPERFKKKKNIACTDTQYDPKDFEVPKPKKEKGKGKGKGKDKGKGKGKGKAEKGKKGKK